MEKSLKHVILNLQLFADDGEDQKDQGQPKEEPGAEKYIKAIEELRENTVPKDKFKKLEEENRLLLSSLIDGKEPPESVRKAIEKKEDKPKRIEQLRGDLFGPNRRDMSNLESASALVELRNLMIEEYGEDPVMSSMKNPTQEDKKAAEDAFALIESCIEQADGDSAVFTAILQSHMQDDKLLAAAARRPKR